MSSIPEHDEERNTGADGQDDRTPTENENQAGNVPAETPANTPVDDQRANLRQRRPAPRRGSTRVCRSMCARIGLRG